MNWIEISSVFIIATSACTGYTTSVEDSFIEKLLASKKINALADIIAEKAIDKFKNYTNNNNETIHTNSDTVFHASKLARNKGMLEAKNTSQIQHRIKDINFRNISVSPLRSLSLKYNQFKKLHAIHNVTHTTPEGKAKELIKNGQRNLNEESTESEEKSIELDNTNKTSEEKTNEEHEKKKEKNQKEKTNKKNEYEKEMKEAFRVVRRGKEREEESDEERKEENEDASKEEGEVEKEEKRKEKIEGEEEREEKGKEEIKGEEKREEKQKDEIKGKEEHEEKKKDEIKGKEEREEKKKKEIEEEKKEEVNEKEKREKETEKGEEKKKGKEKKRKRKHAKKKRHTKNKTTQADYKTEKLPGSTALIQRKRMIDSAGFLPSTKGAILRREGNKVFVIGTAASDYQEYYEALEKTLNGI